MRFLIDGYNLLFALGLAGQRSGPRSLERARAELLAWVHRAHGAGVTDVTVVFDGAEAGSETHPVQIDRGLHVHFSVGQTADDLMEEMIRRTVDPRRLTVVSSDHRIQQAARRRNCAPWDAVEYIDWALERGQPPPAAPPQAAKPDHRSPEEVARWLAEFGPLDDDPDLQKFNRPFKDFDKPD